MDPPAILGRPGSSIIDDHVLKKRKSEDEQVQGGLTGEGVDITMAEDSISDIGNEKDTGSSSLSYAGMALFRRIANVIPKVVKIVYKILVGDRGRFVRRTIMVDLNKPMVSSIQIDGEILKLEYEGLQQIWLMLMMAKALLLVTMWGIHLWSLMVAASKKRQVRRTVEDNGKGKQVVSNFSVSQFQILEDDGDGGEQGEGPSSAQGREPRMLMIKRLRRE
ncbi:hypothetical protein F3Y22_tig00111210pilonHSYRG00210 [Hibiscus syriacus]|uniref:Uncharacterized protein n=1 Tax=Hibiscus syriacus TaxID=106335 RepID=A0A6A2YWB8_HIBSY|nr:hypothetical protein F3Y22_tig00111210pilonHSYRG00210 [Hibiscus syriacus]